MKYFKYLIVVLSLCTTISIKAQTQVLDTTITSNYDTVIIFHPMELNGCIMTYDTNAIHNTGASYFNYYQEATHQLVDSNGNWTNVFRITDGGIISSNNYYPECFAQPYHFDTAVYVCGIAAKVGGEITCQSNVPGQGQFDMTNHFRLLDKKHNEMAISLNFIYPSYYLNQAYTYDSFDTIIKLQDFYLAADVPHNNHTYLNYGHTCSIFDTIWHDTIIGCQSDVTPLFKKNGVWKSFAEDSVYQFYQKTFIEFLPIILLPHNTSGLKDIDLENMCYIYPNPSKNNLNIQSDFKIKDIIVFNMFGEKVIEKKLNNYEMQLDISSLKSGNYIIKLNTIKGQINKRFIKE